MWAGPAGAPAAAMVDRSRTISRSLSPMPQSQFSIWSCLINEARCPCERIADNFHDNLAVEWNNKGRKLEQPSQTSKSTLRYFLQNLRVQVPLEQYYSRSRHVTYICPKRFRFFFGGGTQQKDCSSTGQQHHLGGPWAPLVMALRDLGVNLRWKLTAGLLLWLKAWYPFLSYHTVTLLQFRIAHVWPEHGTSIILASQTTCDIMADATTDECLFYFASRHIRKGMFIKLFQSSSPSSILIKLCNNNCTKKKH